MYFVTFDDPALMTIANRIVEALEIEWFFNIQLVGDTVIEVNPRISTVIYQEDLNLPYLGVKRALGELGDDELEALRARVRPGRTALRYFDQLEWDAEAWRGEGRQLPGQRCRDPLGQLPGASAQGDRGTARRLRARRAPSGGRLVARPPRR